MLDQHQRYEELCALAATGQVPETEVAALHAHLGDCIQCSSLLADFARTSAYLATSHAFSQRSEGVPDGITERFIARARTQGIAMSPGRVDRETKLLAGIWLKASMVTAAALVIVIAIFLRIKPTAYRISYQNAALHTDVAKQGVVPDPVPRPTREEDQALRTDIKPSTRQLKASREAAATYQRENEALQERIAVLGREKEELQAKTEQQIATISKLEADANRMNSEKAANDVAILAEEAELRELRQKLEQKEAVLDEQKRLLAAGNQARDLVVARNLHIVDVYDADGEGNEERAFGRIFYTEGKSLVFYAYDLASPGHFDRQISFYAWGERLGRRQAVTKLGIFRNEDVNEGRWSLTFEDPLVLARINSVFVTGEDSKKAVTRPTGRRILFGFLGNKPNHP